MTFVELEKKGKKKRRKKKNVASDFECDNEPSGSIKRGNFFD
jgi:hypothetical protein